MPEANLVTMAWSSENLLLNAYRQSTFGVPSLVCVDTTHRLVREREYRLSLASLSALSAPCLD